MGGNSSKCKIAGAAQGRGSTVTVNTIVGKVIDEESCLPQEKRQTKDKKKSKSKDKVKVKGVKGNKTDKGKDVGCKNHTRVSFEDAGTDGTSQRCRKKSACPSCDARDMLLVQVRSRSGSLRYSDFSKVVRQSRVYGLDEDPAEIFLDGVPDPIADTVCFICGVYTGSVTRSCRVCCHVYHNGCLQKIGQAMDQIAIQLAQMDMWSCHQCSDVSRLLTREETQQAFNCLEGLKVDPDSIAVNDYIEYKQKVCTILGRDVTSEKKLAWVGRFNAVAGNGGGTTLDWSQFLQAETISFLRRRCKESLVKLMTEMELSLARRMYNELVQDGNDVKVVQVKDRIMRLYAQFGIKPWPEDQEDVACLDEEEFNRTVSWNEFLSLLAIHMVTVRENNMKVPPTTNNDPSIDGTDYNNHTNGNQVALAASLDSIAECNHSCDSDLNSSTIEFGTLSRGKPGHKKNLSDVQVLDESSDANKSLSILDDLSRAFNLDGKGASLSKSEHDDTQQSDLNNAPAEDKAQLEDSLPVSSEDMSPNRTSATQKSHLWSNPPNIRDNPNFTRSVDVIETRVNTVRTKSLLQLEKSPVITKRRSEVLVRPSTEEGRSPRKAFSQKLVAPAYGLVDKIQNQEWQC